MILSTIAFCKRATCPSSQALLDYETCALAAEQMLKVASHLDECDFCGAEFQLLREHPLAAEEVSVPEMPSHLRCLAQSLFTTDWLLHIESLAETAYEKERLTLTDA